MTVNDAVNVALNYIRDHLDICSDAVDRSLLHTDMEQKAYIMIHDEAGLKRMAGLILDVNPAEICSQIESDNLNYWCKNLQIEMQMALINMKGIQ